MAVNVNQTSRFPVNPPAHTGAGPISFELANGATPPSGVVVFVHQSGPGTGANSANYVTSVTYGGVNIPRVLEATASTPGESEPFYISTYFLGSGVPAGVSETVVVNRVNNSVGMWAVCVTFDSVGATNTALHDVQTWNATAIELFGTKPVLDMSNGTGSLRYMTVATGASVPPSAATGAIRPTSIDYGLYSSGLYRETPASQGSFDIGILDTTDFVTAVAFAVMEVPIGTIYWAVYPSAQADPTANEIITAAVPNGIHSNDLSPTVDASPFTGALISGLTSSTSYKLAMVWHDGSRTSNVSIGEAFTTSAVVTPDVGAIVATGYSPTIPIGDEVLLVPPYATITVTGYSPSATAGSSVPFLYGVNAINIYAANIVPGVSVNF